MNIINLKPIFNHLVIKPFKAKTQTEQGFYLPESSQKKPNVAEVIAVGPDCKSGVKIGDLIVIPKNMQVSTDVEVQGEDQCIIKEENVIAIINIKED